MIVTLDHTEQQAANIRSFYFRPEKPLRYIAGQFIELYLPHDNRDNRGDKRWFTLSSAPEEELLAITTNFSHPAGSSFKQGLLDLQPGNQVTMSSSMGDFVLPKDVSIPLLFIAGGIGCTPFRSMIASMQASHEQRDITLLYGARAAKDVAFTKLFESQLGDRFNVILSEPSANWNGPNVRLTVDKVIEIANPRPEHYIYISGSEPLVETLCKDFKQCGFNKRHLLGDYFPNYSE